MSKLRQRIVSPAISAAFLSSLLGIAGGARADDAEGPAPHAPANVPTQGAEPVTEAGAQGPQFSEESADSSTSEPTFETETSRMTWPNTPLLATGATAFGLSYVPAVLGGALADDADHRKDLYIPVAGPFMMLTQGREPDAGIKALLIADGAVQGLGALMLISSFFIPEKRTSHWYLLGSNDVRIAPSNVGTGYGMGAVGRF